MKRTAAVAGLDQQESFSRQQPSSCTSCRKRKLKCSRDNPCSNCTVRGIECIPAGNALVSLAPQVQVNTSIVNRHKVREQGLGSSTESIESRAINPKIQLTAHSGTHPVVKPLTPDSSVLTPGQPDIAAGDDHDDNDLNRQALQFEADATQLRDLSGPDTPSSWPTVNIMFPSAAPRRHLASITQAEVIKILPSSGRAHRLLDHFVDNLQWTLHICHTPTLRRSLSKLYRDIDSGTIVDMREVALHSAILGVSAAYPSKSLSLPEVEAMQLAQSLTQLAQRALVEVDYLKSPSLTTLQAALLLGYMIVPEAGGLTTVLLALRAAIHCAQALGLHRLDSPRFIKQREQQGSVDHVYLEVGRRIYWQLAASDWLISTISGPYTSTYFIHPDQFQLQLPANCDDESLDEEAAYGRPLHVPTEISHTLARIGLASMYREVVDTANQQGVEVHELDYETVQRLDAKFEAYLDNLPYFLKLDQESRARSRAIDKEKPFLAWARAGTHCAWHMRRIQIHRRWLAPVPESHEPPCLASRDVCLSSARAVVALEQEMYESVLNHVPNFSRHWALVHHLLVASLVLAMEYARGVASIRPELLNCCHALERSQNTSTIAWKGLQQLQCILRRWSRNQAQDELESNAAPMRRQEATDPTPFMGSVPDLQLLSHTEDENMQEWHATNDMPASDNAMFGDIFNDLWLNTLDLPTGLEPGEWDALFQEL